ncbi:MAG: aminopeptidase [Candidatus Diapherotrites archaeon]|nr:aminopeptidase [Candidatus Diapherotrites archaeon]
MGESALEKKLLLKKESAWTKFSEQERKMAFTMGDNYKVFLDAVKTEREAVKEIIKRAKAKGFEDIAKSKELSYGDKVYFVFKEKAVALIVIGKEGLETGLNVTGAHIDSPRLDLKPTPLYEDSSLALFKTRPYGGVKYYQWANVPLALHGVIVKKDGTKIDFVIGENEKDPVFVIGDLLPHLSRKQDAERKAKDTLKGEELNVIVGGIPIDDKDAKQKVKLAVMNILNTSHGLIEEDLASAEIEVVPATKAKDVGFDRSMIGSYGQDDRSCAFSQLNAIMGVQKPKRTCLALFVDKEEIGSTGNTGAQSFILENIVREIISRSKNKDYSAVKIALQNSKALSADVTAGVNPTFKDAHDEKNAIYIGHGIAIDPLVKTGASAEYLGEIRKLWNDKKVPWQIGELGKIDLGGGGTVAMFFSKYGLDIIDAGIPLISMHSPFEISSKADIFSAYKAYLVFLSS